MNSPHAQESDLPAAAVVHAWVQPLEAYEAAAEAALSQLADDLEMPREFFAHQLQSAIEIEALPRQVRHRERQARGQAWAEDAARRVSAALSEDAAHGGELSAETGESTT